MSHPCALRIHVCLVLGALSNDDWHTVDHVDAVLEELTALVRVVGDQFDGGDAHAVQHFRCEVVFAGIAWQAKSEVGIKGIEAGVLQSVCLHL